MITVRQLIQSKGSNVWTVAPDAPVYDALKLMAEKNVGALVVLTEGKVVGILSERDYARKVILYGKSAHEVPVREIMTQEVVCVQPNQTVEDCMKTMTARHIRHLPVVESDAVVGLISIGDVVKSIISQQEHVISQLEGYISGR